MIPFGYIDVGRKHSMDHHYQIGNVNTKYKMHMATHAPSPFALTHSNYDKIFVFEQFKANLDLCTSVPHSHSYTQVQVQVLALAMPHSCI